MVANKGRVLTYEQIYQKIWHEEALGNENNAIGCHIRNLREKLGKALPDTLGSGCGGNFRWLPDGTKDCSACLAPHGRGSYSFVIGKFGQLSELAKRNR